MVEAPSVRASRNANRLLLSDRSALPRAVLCEGLGTVHGDDTRSMIGSGSFSRSLRMDLYPYSRRKQ